MDRREFIKSVGIAAAMPLSAITAPAETYPFKEYYKTRGMNWRGRITIERCWADGRPWFYGIGHHCACRGCYRHIGLAPEKTTGIDGFCDGFFNHHYPMADWNKFSTPLGIEKSEEYLIKHERPKWWSTDQHLISNGSGPRGLHAGIHFFCSNQEDSAELVMSGEVFWCDPPTQPPRLVYPSGQWVPYDANC